MNMLFLYVVVFGLLLVVEQVYFKIADKCNIIDKPNERSSHSSIVLRGGGVIFSLSMLVWFVMTSASGGWTTVAEYGPFLVGLLLVAGVSFWDDVRSLPDSVRLVVQFIAMGLMSWSMGIFTVESYELGVMNQWMQILLIIVLVLAALIVCVGATNIINFMDGINGITAGYSLAVLVPLTLLNRDFAFIDTSFLIVATLGVLVFCIFNFRPKGKAKCFAGDVGSISIAFIMLFAIGRLVVQTQDVTYLIFLLVYGVDGCLTICHRILLHEKLGEAHRKHAYQLMANELKIGHVKVSLLYMSLQLIVSFGFIFICPNTVMAHWIYLGGSLMLFSIAYALFKKKYYHLHEAYLRSISQR